MPDIKAINGNVFVIRDEQEECRDGIEFTDRVQVKSLNGTIAFIDGECEFAKPGDRVHIPHYGVEDIEYNDTEYAMFKASRLFFVNGEPANKYVLVRKCENDHIRDEKGDIALYMTEKHIETTNWVEVLDAAPDCDSMSNRDKGMFTPLPESHEQLARIGDSKDFCVHESIIEFVTDGE